MPVCTSIHASLLIARDMRASLRLKTTSVHTVARSACVSLALRGILSDKARMLRGQVNDVMKQMDRIWQIRDLGMTFSEFMREMELEVRRIGPSRLMGGMPCMLTGWL